LKGLKGLKRRGESGERRENSGERIAERVGGSLEFRVESSFSISLRKRPCGSSGEVEALRSRGVEKLRR
jgi:hypothetical protein